MIIDKCFVSVTSLASRFPQIVKEEDKDDLADELLDFTLTPKEDLPDFSDKNVAKYWIEMGKIQMSYGRKLRFPNLSNLAKACVVLPVSNAEPERIFSMLKKIQTEFRSELKNDTICSIIGAKQNQDKKCYEYEPCESVLKNAKAATMLYNASHQ